MIYTFANHLCACSTARDKLCTNLLEETHLVVYPTRAGYLPIYKIIENNTSIGDLTVRGFDTHETTLMSARTNNIQHDRIPFFHDILDIMNKIRKR